MSRQTRPVEVALFDYGAGNLHSLAKGLEAGGARVTVTTRWDEALAREALVLPGVGSFGAAVQALAGSEAQVREALEAGLPCLGICLGMQLLFDSSEESDGAGIGLIPGRVRRIRARTVPQMGWNDVEPAPATESQAQGSGEPLFRELDGMTAYYANSYVCEPVDEADTIAWSTYGHDRFAAAVRRGRCWGVQFHPEKSSAPGLRLLENFLDEVEGS
ncbi:MAG: imidazole glycerol phosphate synthase subunit HisH [Gemmatimonadales bacterium]|nr:MAG: imidazole glycerol phosphate synthase subunit HisH [Gemmatimonadales bacterium]